MTFSLSLSYVGSGVALSRFGVPGSRVAAVVVQPYTVQRWSVSALIQSRSATGSNLLSKMHVLPSTKKAAWSLYGFNTLTRTWVGRIWGDR